MSKKAWNQFKDLTSVHVCAVKHNKYTFTMEKKKISLIYSCVN